jgi:hypothetical protein
VLCSTGVIGRKDAGGLDVLVEKVLGEYFSKDPSVRQCEEWEAKDLHSELQRYAALDAFASQMVFEQITKFHSWIGSDMMPLRALGWFYLYKRVAKRLYAAVAAIQPTSFQGIRIDMPSKTRVVVDIDSVRLPSAVAVLHLLPSAANSTI